MLKLDELSFIRHQLNIPVFAVIIAVIILTKHLLHRPKYPPGPPRWPFIGNILHLSLKGGWKPLTAFRETYGDLIFFNGLGSTVLVLNSLDAINDLLDKRANISSDRPIFTVAGELMGLNQSMGLIPYGEEWREQRKVAHMALSLAAVKKYHRLLELRLTMGTIIIATTYGISTESAQDEYIALAEETMKLVGKATVPGAYLCDLMPVLKHLPGWVPFRREAELGRIMMESCVNKPFQQVQSEISQGYAPPSLVGDILTSNEIAPRHLNTVKWAAGSLYGAGAESTYATVLTFIMAMALNPEKQRLAHAEMDRVVGLERLPRMQDRENLPYVSAIIKETARWHPVVPLGIARRTSVDDFFRGFYIPKGTIIIPNLWYCLFNTWSNFPHLTKAFIPERFLDTDHSHIDPASWNFGFGRRVCPGKALAENSVYILVASLLWTFTFAVDESEGLVPQFTENLVSYPKPFKCIISPRSASHRTLVQDAVSNAKQSQ
ncbi:cytochrome P450 [Gymnopilus junonius]|uniref:Cytochrome P450 n=1 Tax=Gymnopilus junonius TaxID=109634 RepID=A0A9P5NB10_GYMJU|nr:cytochrome P450 [Gymnopilus junonius]